MSTTRRTDAVPDAVTDAVTDAVPHAGREAGVAQRLALGALLCGLALFCVLMVLRPLPPAVGSALSLGVQTVTVLAACVCMAVRARGATGRLRRARGLLSASLVMATLGGVLALVLPVLTGHPAPLPSLADAAHFGYLPLCVAGVLSYPLSDEEAGSAARTLLDGVVAAAALWFVTYVLLLAPAHVGAGLPRLAALTVLAYPAADVFVIAMAAGALHRVTAAARRELALTAAGVSLYALSDIAYTVLASRGRYTSDSWVGAAAESGLVLLLLGVVRERPAPARPPGWTRWVGVLPYGPLVLSVALIGWLSVRGEAMQAGELGLLSVVLTALLLRLVAGNRDRNEITRRLRERKALFRSLVTGSADFITLHDLAGTVLYASPPVARLTGLSLEELAHVRLGDLVHPDDRGGVREAAEGFLRSPGSEAELLLRVRSADGSWRWCRTLAHDLRSDPDVRGIVCNTRDVHERHLLEQQVQHDAYHDALTGLGNLAQARALLDAVCAPDAATEATVALIDLDGFKQVNDTFGHGQGDALLTAVAARLRSCVREEDAVTRIGGDEFLIVLADTVEGDLIGERVLSVLREPLLVLGRPLTIGASVGLATTLDRPTPDELLRNADLAMYSAKAAGRNRYAWYAPSLHQAATQRMDLTRGLRRALAEEQLTLHYQPVVRLPDARVVGAEALLRWQPPDGPAVPPDVFLPVAEEAGLMREVDAWVLDRACRDLAAWRADGVDVPQVCVNVSPRHLTPDLPGVVGAALARHGLPGSVLCLEITESAVAPDPQVALAVLGALRATGVRIALDDFGTGESSLAQLRQLPLDAVKIDRSFLPTSPQDAGAWQLLRSVIGVCDALSLPVVVEGVEEPGTVAELVATGCAYAQGFHFGRPQPPAELVRALAVRAPAS